MTASGGDRPPFDAKRMRGLLPLPSAEIHLWLAFYDEIDESLHSAYRELLNADERNQEPRFYFATDRRRYLVTRALVRTILSRYLAIEPCDLTFANNAYGRPETTNAEAREACLTFNISHTRSLIVMGVTTHRALGVDVENVRAREALIDIVDRFFAPQEVAALAQMPSHQQHFRFFEYWTFKESYIKARGMGLSLPLDKFSFHYHGDHAVRIAIDPDSGDDAGHWQFWQFQPRPEYLVAICAERVESQPPRVIVRQAVPMLSETEYTPEFLRVSV